MVSIPANPAQGAALQALLGYRILDTPPEQPFDDLIELAAAVCDTSMAVILFVDGRRSWPKAKCGVGRPAFADGAALGAEAVQHADIFVSPDTPEGIGFFAAAPLVTPGGNTIGSVCVFDELPRELTSRQEDALRALAALVMVQLELRRVSHGSTDDKFRGLVDQLPGVVYIEDLGTTSGSYFSPQIEHVTGYTPEEAVQQADFFFKILHPEDRERVLAAFAASHDTHEPIEIEYRVVAKDGRIVWIQDNGAVALNSKNGQPRYFQGLMMDVTERRALAEEHARLLERVSAQNERLLDVDRLKDELLATVSHELRTPLTSILGYLDLLAEEDTFTEEQRKYHQVIDNNARRLQELVLDLLFVAQAQAGPVVLDRDPVAFEGVVEQAVAAAGPAAEARGIELALSSDGEQGVVGDARRLGQVVDNLVSNAVKFTPRGGSVAVRLFERGNGRVVLEVSDTGMGIAAVDQGRLFQRFFRAEAARSKAIQGTGLGLSIAKAIVDGHGGKITVQSTEGVGTTFQVSLPKAPVLHEATRLA